MGSINNIESPLNIESEEKNIHAKKLSLKQWIIILPILIISIVGLSFGLYYLGDKSPILDSTSTLLSIFGMILMIKFYREQWYVWLAVNIVSVGIYITLIVKDPSDLPSILYLVMWAFYIINSIIGIIKWRK
jgi:nicotinamide mononucleotide transporter